MLASHRDQENLVRSQRVSSKQQHLKTPGARFPKTPGPFGQNDENAPTAFTGKTGLGGAKQFGNDKTGMKPKGPRQAMETPMGTQSRAPLGNKTTNAKARTGQTGGVKGMVNKLEKSQLRPTTHKRKQLSVEMAPLQFKSKDEQKTVGEQEPEYAPPRPQDRPYESDVFTDDVLQDDGLVKMHVQNGFYPFWADTVGGKGVPDQDQEYDETMHKVTNKAGSRNQHKTANVEWNMRDKQSPPRQLKNHLVKREPLKAPSRLVKKQPSTLASRRAASALSMASDTSRSTDAPLPIRTTKTRKPLSTMLQGKRPTAVAKTSTTESAAGEAASRTTIGYSRGRVASSMLQTHRRVVSETVQPARTVKPAQSSESFSSDMTITPARLRQAAYMRSQETRPVFTFLFEEEDDHNEDIIPIRRPLPPSDDEEEFELSLGLEETHV
ncbi:hypothetical protein B0T10DRAFT_282871 [Thelonectria olida]|uniref:Uncharacterized protein n=1 Tax=Thelonectria olida TaxID=1576542 RepID=A0A9P9ANE8_9HYPO|nr:hypothetical protein B0T10DRAFT_282871 [Thelonectria olida]